MFESLSTLPADPIFGLMSEYAEEKNPKKINLSVGVYQDASGQTPIFSAVKKAEQQLIDAQQTKVYAPLSGDPAFLEGITSLLFGETLAKQNDYRISTVMTPGGCGALNMGAKLLMQSSGSSTIWVSDPTWGNHYPLLESSGLELKNYPYYDAETKGVKFDAMISALKKIPEGDTVLLHGCCHNPTGADLTEQQWSEVVTVLDNRNLLPFFDVAYQGFGDSLDQDAYGFRLAVSELSEVLIASSCSKNFGLYRERVGAITAVAQSASHAEAIESHILSAARCCYSMPPSHGGEIVGHLLSDQELTDEWITELNQIKMRVNSLKTRLVKDLNGAQSKVDFSFLDSSKGMFCYLGMPKEDILRLRSEFGIYLLDSGRINVAGLSEANLPILVDSISTVISR